MREREIERDMRDNERERDINTKYGKYKTGS